MCKKQFIYGYNTKVLYKDECCENLIKLNYITSDILLSLYKWISHPDHLELLY